REEKERERQERERAQLERRVLQEYQNVAFSGRLPAMRKERLQDVAFALKLPIDGTLKDLLERIRARFKDEPNLWYHPRYAGLFDPELPELKERASRARRRARETHSGDCEEEEEENISPKAHDADGPSQLDTVPIQQTLPSAGPPHPSAYSMYTF
ncbi:hypothetical protein HDZ31DRAFT_78887, partial [Schizophyllum fasciatum]